MEMKKPDVGINGILVKLFRRLLEVKGLDGRMVSRVATKKLKLQDKDFNNLKRLASSDTLTFKSFIWLLSIFLDIKSIDIRITVEDQQGNIDEVSIRTELNKDAGLSG